MSAGPLPRLITIPISHYGERARWALDRAGIEYIEEHHLQMFAWGPAFLHGGKKTVPLLLLPGGTCLNDSGIILDWASRQCAEPYYPDDAAERRAVEELEAKLVAYGVETRRVTYSWVLNDPSTLEYNYGRAPGWQQAFFRNAFGVARKFAKQYLAVNPAALAIAHETIERTLDDVALQLSDGRAFLMGERFTAADLTFAAMSAAVLLPREYGVPLPEAEQAIDGVRDKLLEWREHPAAVFALRLYRDERRRVLKSTTA
ncbi:MAG: glutathione S-transferase family protein [Polyangiaceae bacterium]|nr:glutathione S-transferase family protein [Polyangiaceae bacterium]